MLRKLLSLALCVVMLLTLVPMTASADYLSIGAPAETVRPGKAIVIVFESPAAGTAVIQLVNQLQTPFVNLSGIFSGQELPPLDRFVQVRYNRM